VGLCEEICEGGRGGTWSMMVSLSLRLVQGRRSGIWVQWAIPTCAYARRPPLSLSLSKRAPFPFPYLLSGLPTMTQRPILGRPLTHPAFPLPYSGGLPVYLQAKV
jgi:hypothetical protein